MFWFVLKIVGGWLLVVRLVEVVRFFEIMSCLMGFGCMFGSFVIFVCFDGDVYGDVYWVVICVVMVGIVILFYGMEFR